MTVLVAAAGTLGALGASGPPRPGPPPPFVIGRLRAPGGPFLFTAHGRVVLLHGVDVVYKHPPYEVYPDPGKPWSFTAATARRLAGLGFNVVRLGVLWAGLEPGTRPANTVRICAGGPPGDPHQYVAAVLYRYLAHLRQTVDLLARYHIYTILDMHQDVYNQLFDGEGAPDWAVCTDGVPVTDPPGRWSLTYGTRAAGIAFDHFWRNDVVGDLQGQFDMVWGKAAAYFRHDPWVLGFDPFNEPFSASVLRRGSEHFDGQLECFYTGRLHVGRSLEGLPPIRCPVDDPATGVIPTLEHADPGALVFFEPDLYSSRGFSSSLGPMDFPNLVYNVHVYCPERSPVTGNPTTVRRCAAHDVRSVLRDGLERVDLASSAQRGGPAWLVTEFGASASSALTQDNVATFDSQPVGWIYWSWKRYDDPTGSLDEALVEADGRLRPTARVLSQADAVAVAGIPEKMSFDPVTGAFFLRYRANDRLGAPTVVVVPTGQHYARGYCATAAGATLERAAGGSRLLVRNNPRARVVTVRITADPCGGPRPR